MAGVSTKDIKNRIRSMESTKQITKAMEMVAASKLRRAQAQVSNSRPYFEILSNTITSIIRSNSDFSSPYLKARPVKKVLYIVVAGTGLQIGRGEVPVCADDAADGVGKEIKIGAGIGNLCLGTAELGGSDHFHGLGDLLGALHASDSVFNFLGGDASHAVTPSLMR